MKFIYTGCLVLAMVILPFSSAFPTGEDDENSECFECHGSDQSLTAEFADGSEVSVYVDQKLYRASVHGQEGLSCRTCHADIDLEAHPGRELKDRRSYTLASSDICQECHADISEKYSDDIHRQLINQGNHQAAICADCHNPHYTSKPGQPRAKISQTCSQCHQQVYNKYAGSIHGSALIKDDNPDVPVCTDCHRAHHIKESKNIMFHLDSVDLCSDCHSNKQLMNKYDISTDVIQSYLQDFHGVSIGFYRKEGGKSRTDMLAPTCIDCHGAHEIAKMDSPQSLAIKENLTKVCQKCHPGAPPNFSDAWLSHYIPSLKKAPLVFLVKLFYWIFIPFIILGLALQVVMDLNHALRRKSKSAHQRQGGKK